MTSRTTKIILKEAILFSLLLAFLWALSSEVLLYCTEGKDQSHQAKFTIDWVLLEQLIELGVLFWMLWRVARKLQSDQYWPLVVSAITFFIVLYHINFCYYTVYFNMTHPNYVEKDPNSLESLLTLFHGRNSAPPVYDPIGSFFRFFIELKNIRYNLNFQFLMESFALNPVVLSFWLSVLPWAHFRNKRIMENANQSTSDNG